jgi:hypothetical protein
VVTTFKQIVPPQGYKVYSPPAAIAVAPNGHRLYWDGEWFDETAYYSR